MFGGEQKRRSMDDVVAYSTRIGPDAQFQGEFSGAGDYAVAGHVNGQCHIDGVLYIEPTGSWQGDIQAGTVVIAGTVNGNVHAIEKLVLEKGAIVKAKLTAKAIAISEGACYQGKISMTGTSNITRFSEKRSSGHKED
ncbi:MAG: polymer-forming cytoskeletal protein [Gammaproteobacteria bacterium]|nr:polymer-forming cytoskeletal protein [Gammaproteobacteria bacterium]